MERPATITLLELNQRIARAVANPQMQSVWITAELSDFSVRGGHCYMELLQKDDDGRIVAKSRAAIWASNYSRIYYKFLNATGKELATGMKAMLLASVTMHAVYGLMVVISDIDPSYTMGDLQRRREEILARLKAMGILDDNRNLPWPEFPSRVAVISAPQAAGYGDFCNQLFRNPSHLRFTVQLFPAIMQGEKAPASVLAQLQAIAQESDRWDCVVIIRGGGATSDLAAFEDAALAEAVAQFPLPVIVGIGHERDITVLDFIANTRVKTPTAAAEFLIDFGDRLLGRLQSLSASLLQTATDIIAGSRQQLSYNEGLLPVAAVNAVERSRRRLDRCVMSLGGISARRIAPELERLRFKQESIPQITAGALSRAATRLNGAEQLLAALSPEAVLRRGYSITRIDGRAVRSVAELTPGTRIDTVLPDGTASSTVL